mmetsp:Transcript_11322/g.16773  ORF Transcript_11322/g.16773 Transcript_11322/m.16773 type:complete len:424 (-) Transcript_11322:16-1287(-)
MEEWKNVRINKNEDIDDQLEDYDSKEVWKIGLRYYSGDEEIAKEEETAFRIFKYNAIENDHLLSISELGCMYFIGIGIKKSYKSAINWWNRLDVLVPEACYGLGVIYYNGAKDESIEKDLDKALHYWKKGAALHDENSIDSLNMFFPHWHAPPSSSSSSGDDYVSSPLTKRPTSRPTPSLHISSSSTRRKVIVTKRKIKVKQKKHQRFNETASKLSKQFSAPVLDIESISGDNQVIVPIKDRFSSSSSTLITPRSRLRESGRFRVDMPSSSSSTSPFSSSPPPIDPTLSLSHSLSYLKDSILDIQLSLDALSDASLSSKASSIKDMQHIAHLYTLLNGSSMSVTLEELRLTQLSLLSSADSDSLELSLLSSTAIDHSESIALLESSFSSLSSKYDLFLSQQQLINDMLRSSHHASLFPLIHSS